MPFPPATYNSPNYYQAPTQQQSYGLPPQNNGQGYGLQQPNLPPQIPQAGSAFEPPKSEVNQHAQVASQLSGGPINASTYQPYLAYGAPPSNVPASGFQQFSPPATGNYCSFKQTNIKILSSTAGAILYAQLFDAEHFYSTTAASIFGPVFQFGCFAATNFQQPTYAIIV